MKNSVSKLCYGIKDMLCYVFVVKKLVSKKTCLGSSVKARENTDKIVQR